MKKNPENLSKIIIPNNSKLPNGNEELLENLENISPEEIENIGNKVYLNGIINKLKKGISENLGKPDAIALINSDNIDIFLDNIDKFKGLDLEVAKALINKNCDIGNIIFHFGKKDRKAVILLAIKSGSSVNIAHLPLTDRNLDFANQMIENGFDPKKLGGSILGAFQEKDRKQIALMAIKAGGNINLNNIPKEDRNLNFANLMVENGFDPRKLGKILGLFKETDRTDIALIAIKAGADYIDLSNIPLKYCNLDFAKKMIENGFDPRKLGNLLNGFKNEDRKQIALIAIKAGGNISLHLIPPKDLDDELANAMIVAGFKDDVKKNKKRFNLKLRTKMRLW